MRGAGQRRYQVTIQTKTTTANSYNEQIETWADTTTVWADIINDGGREFQQAKKINAETSAIFIMPYYSLSTANNRLKYGTRIFDILHINNEYGIGQEMSISAKEVI